MNDDGASREEQLLSACMSGQSDMLKSLLGGTETVNINHTNGLGFTALHYAAQVGSVECIQMLSKHKEINPNIQERIGKNTPLHLALIHGEDEESTLDIVRLLTKAGADPGIVNKAKQRPRDLAEHEEEEIQRVLLQAGLAIEAKKAQAFYNDQEDEDDYSSG
ncbi:hypothetical protein GGH19_002263 [Coemansia sp. RSA 1807]|nr:hypothetical protein LPJ58_002055 [Coemansia sp. RSA 1591]KAJ1764186.1 hypothetical protein LPJ69_001997 [Coemansia sp. RSA 1752]KAJ1791006.1 hypothetical protein LPJ67_001979 [Coemansia sp. RSA 1938]KAJ2127696.1 hypothetical protein GGF48_003168 [Coemansia sp. RSA 921]KAJ2136309.1 hypothetical protein GGH17_002011 [Coemansia sp. RSA 788]KAJ2223500.1 hypothetical protein IW143_000972 [Coemansia sp. RSA 520]KAJ2229645.1 hypothetical protein EV180_001389 [Coemansia sp. RSA 518]KAJ2257483.1 